MDLGGKEWHIVRGTQEGDRTPRLSPNRQFVYVQGSDQCVYRVARSSGARTKVIVGNVRGFAVTRRNSILFARETAPRASNLFSYRSSGAQVRQVTFTRHYLSFPETNPTDGDLLARDGVQREPKIALISASGRIARISTFAAAGKATWTSDSGIVFADHLEHSGGMAIFRGTWTSTPVELASSPYLSMSSPAVDPVTGDLICAATFKDEHFLRWISTGKSIRRPLPAVNQPPANTASSNGRFARSKK